MVNKKISNEYDTASTILANYDYQDLADGTGLTDLYGYVNSYTTEQGTTETYGYNLTRSTPLSVLRETTVADVSSSSAFTQGSALTFSLGAFKTTKVIEGNAIIENSFQVKNSVGGGSTLYGKLKYLLTKNGVEIGSAFTDYIETSSTTYGDSTPASQNSVVKIPVARTSFAKDDVLGLKVEAWAKTAAGANSTLTVNFGCDPTNRDATNLTPTTDGTSTQLKVTIPFRIDQ